jgi:hypothetical protein
MCYQARITSLQHLGQNNRVRKVSLWNLADRQLERVLAAMQVPFPELTDLHLGLYPNQVRVIPDSFLGGSAPRLRSLTSRGIPFPGLPKLLSSATHLVNVSTCQPLARQYSSFWIHFTQCDHRSPLRVVQPRHTYTSIPIPSISP